jgi:nucleotide-binding universal stress UspA family protein
MKILVYLDEKTDFPRVLSFAAALRTRLGAELAVVTVQPGTQAIEDLPAPGVPLSLQEKDRLPAGVQMLVEALENLIGTGLLLPQDSLTIKDIPLGHLFTGTTPAGERLPFYACFGHRVETLNRLVDEQSFHLLIASPPPSPGLSRFIAGDITRNLILDLHTSLLFVREGGPDDRFLVCADGSPSSRRVFPFLKHMLPAVKDPLEILWIQQTANGPETVRAAEQCLAHAVEWLGNCGRKAVFHRLRGDRPADLILQAAGSPAVIVLGASLRHDLVRRLKGSLPLEIITRTKSSVLLVKLPHEADAAFFKAPFTC